MITLLLFPQKDSLYVAILWLQCKGSFFIDAKYYVIRYYVPLQACTNVWIVI